MTIIDIENLTYNAAKKMALEKIEIKEHTCFLIDLGDRFGYSILVFKDKKHIYYANDYELHHGYHVKKYGKVSLRQYYIDTRNSILFTDSELMEEVKSYDEYQRKIYFLHNYWIMKYDNVTAYCIGNEQEKALKKAKKKYPFFNPFSFCYVADEGIVKEQAKYHNHLERSYEVLRRNDNAFREMVRTELANHEAGYTCDYTEALTALGIKFENLSDNRKNIVKEELQRQIKQNDKNRKRV